MRVREGLGAQYGVTIKDFYLTMGEHDIVAVARRARTPQPPPRRLMTLGMAGNVSTVTMTALTEDEFRRVVSELALRASPVSRASPSRAW